MSVKNFRNNILEDLNFDLSENYVQIHENYNEVILGYSQHGTLWTPTQRNNEARLIFWYSLFKQ